jgi:hypothetical protein
LVTFSKPKRVRKQKSLVDIGEREKEGRKERKKEKWNANAQARFKHAAFVFKWQKVACALILRLVWVREVISSSKLACLGTFSLSGELPILSRFYFVSMTTTSSINVSYI